MTEVIPRRQRQAVAAAEVYDPTMDPPPCDPVRDEVKWAPGFWLDLLAIAVFVGIVVYQVAFIGGTRISNDLVAPSANADAEIRELRVQLDEARRFEDTVLSIMLASFAAGFTILVLVNVGGVVFAQRGQDREERYLRTILHSDAKALDADLARQASEELRNEAGRIYDQVSTITNQVNDLQRQVVELYKASISQYESDRQARFDKLHMQAQIDELAGRLAAAAVHRARLLADLSKSQASWQLTRAMMELEMTLQKLQRTDPSVINRLHSYQSEAIREALDTAEGSGNLSTENIDRARALVTAIEDKQSQAGIPSYDVPPPPVPTTNPFASARPATGPPRRQRRPRTPEPDNSEG